MEKIKQKIKEDISIALKGRESETCSVLRMLLSNILDVEKKKKYKEGKELELTDEEIIMVIVSEAKKRKDSISEFEKGGRQDLVEKEKKELLILKKYLPEQLEEEDVMKIVEKTIEETESKDIKDMGKVMKEAMVKIKGRADAGLVSKIAKELLMK